MIWWNWKLSQRLALVGLMLIAATIPWLLIGEFTADWRGVIGGTGFLFIPQMLAWLLFVGLKTGRMPSAYGRSELRSETPKWYWATGAAYAILLIFYLWVIVGVVLLDL